MTEQITTLFRLCYPGVVRSDGSVRHTLSHEENHILTRFDGETLVGAAVYYDDRILMLCVHPDYRGRGIGQALMETLFCALDDLGISWVTTRFPESAKDIHEFFKKIGFEQKTLEMQLHISPTD